MIAMKMTQTTTYHDEQTPILSQRMFQGMIMTAVLVALVLLGGMAFALFGLVARPQVPPPPITFPTVTILPVERALCPALTLAYSSRAIVHEPIGYIPGEPITFDITRSYWSVTEKRRAQLRSGVSAPVQSDTVSFPNPGEFGSVRRLILPDLPAGEYLLLTSVKTGASTTRGFNVPFTIRADCQP